MAIIKMIKNPPKTKVSLKKAINYITQPGKTRPDLVGGLNCDWVRAYNEFCEVKSQFEKEDGIQAKHFVMSFDVKDNVSVETAKQIADELLKNKLFTNFQVVYAVHKDKDHIHTHFLINSVSFENGKRWHQTAEDLRNLKAFSNEICKSHGLSEMDFNKNAGSLSDIEYQNRFESWKYELYLAMLNSSYRAGNKEDFINILDSIGYKVNWEDNKKYITFTTPDGKKCRNRNIYPRYKFTKEALEKQFEHNVCNIDKNKMLKSQENFIQKVTAQTDVKYPISFIVENEEKQRSMTYNQWYEQNKEYLINDDKYDTYKCIGFAIKNSTNEKEFIDRINRMGLKVEFDRESNITIFTSKQGIEYGNYEMYQGEKYSPKELLKRFEKNNIAKKFREVFWQAIKESDSMSIFKDKLLQNGYDYEYKENNYIFKNRDGLKIDTSSFKEDFQSIFEKNIITKFLLYNKWLSNDISEFFEKLISSNCEIRIENNSILYSFDSHIYKDDNFNIDNLNSYFNMKNDRRELQSILWYIKSCSYSKSDFIEKLNRLGYDVEWKDDGTIKFTTPLKNTFNIEELKSFDFNMETLQEEFAENKINNDFNILCEFLNLFRSRDDIPVTNMMRVHPDLTGEKLREFLYHFEKGTASIYNRNLNDGLSI